MDDRAVLAHHIARNDARRERRCLVAVHVGLPRDLDPVGRHERVALVRHKHVGAVLQLFELEVAVRVRRHHARERGIARERELDPGVRERFARADVEEMARNSRRRLSVLDEVGEAANRVAVEPHRPAAKVEARRGGGHVVRRIARVDLELEAPDRLELERQPPRIARLQDARRMRRAKPHDQHALLRQVVVLVIVGAEDRVGVVQRVVHDERRRVHLRVARVLVDEVTRVEAVVARPVGQVEFHVEDRSLRHLVDVHRVAKRLAVRRHVVVPVCRDVLHVEDRVHARGVDRRHALRLDPAKVELALLRQSRAREREAHVAHVRRRLGIDGPELRRQLLDLNRHRRGRDARILDRKINRLARRARRNDEHGRRRVEDERNRAVDRRRRHVPDRRPRRDRRRARAGDPHDAAGCRKIRELPALRRPRRDRLGGRADCLFGQRQRHRVFAPLRVLHEILLEHVAVRVHVDAHEPVARRRGRHRDARRQRRGRAHLEIVVLRHRSRRQRAAVYGRLDAHDVADRPLRRRVARVADGVVHGQRLARRHARRRERNALHLQVHHGLLRRARNLVDADVGIHTLRVRLARVLHEPHVHARLAPVVQLWRDVAIRRVHARRTRRNPEVPVLRVEEQRIGLDVVDMVNPPSGIPEVGVLPVGIPETASRGIDRTAVVADAVS